MRCLVLRLGSYQIKNSKDIEKYLRHLSNRLYYNADDKNNRPYYNADDKSNFYSTKKFNSPEKRRAIRAKIMNNIRETKIKVESIIERENIWTIPNFLSLGRIVTTPCLSYLIVSHDYQVSLSLYLPFNLFLNY